jgi:phosphate acetyltransferase
MLSSAELLVHPLLGPLIRRLRAHPKRVVFPDGQDPRVLRVAAKLVELGCVSPILLGSKPEITALAKQEGISLEFVRILRPQDSSDFQAYCERYRRTSRYLRRPIPDVEEIMVKPSYFAAMMALYNAADAIVGGNDSVPSAYFRSLFHILPRQIGLDSSTSFLPIFLPERRDLGANGVLFLTDCAVIPSPTIGQLAYAAVATGRAAEEILSERPRIAFLSFATRTTARSLSTEKTSAAVAMARMLLQQQPLKVSGEMELDGPLQLDSALDPAAAARKAGPGPVAGKANVLVFPDLNSSHISFKLLQLLGHAETFGHHVIGLTRPAAQVSQVAPEITILGAALFAAHQSAELRPLLLAEPD